MSFEEILFVFCSVTKIYFWHFKTYLVNAFGNPDDSIEYRKMYRHSFAKDESSLYM